MPVQTDKEVDALQGLDFEPDLPIPCTHEAARGESAVWVVRCLGCRNGEFMCNKHLRRLKRWMNTRKRGAECSLCGWRGRSAEDLMDVEPLRVRHGR